MKILRTQDIFDGIQFAQNEKVGIIQFTQCDYFIWVSYFGDYTFGRKTFDEGIVLVIHYCLENCEAWFVLEFTKDRYYHYLLLIYILL